MTTSPQFATVLAGLADGLGGLVASTVDRAAGLDPRYLVGALLLQLVNVALRAVAWRNVLTAAYPRQRIRTFPLACAYAAGVALNGFLPARGGEAAKVGLARAQIPGSAVPTIAGALSLVLVLDALLGFGLVVTLWAFGVLPALPALPMGQLPLVAAGLAVLGVVVVVALWTRPALVRDLVRRVARGLAVLRTPRRYATTVVPFQVGAWCCRVGVVFLALGAFGIHAGLGTAALLVVLNGLSTAVPVPGGAGAQQAFAAYALQGVVSAAGAVSFSVGMQIGITVVNTVVGLTAAMILFRTLRPLAALRAARAG
jgi:hypothetical protein